MRILLIEPAKEPVTLGGEDLSVFEPLALEYVGAGVSSEHDVRILDQRLDKDVGRALDGFRPDIVGISAYTVHVGVARALCEQVKTWRPATLTVVGGHHATVAPRDFVSPFIDLIVAGEGVSAFRTIVERFERGQAFTGIPGVAFTRNQTLVMEARPAAVDLDALPFPDRALTAQYRHEYFAEFMKPLASIRTSKGCPFRCNFCALWKLTEGRYLRRAPERIVEELAGIAEECVFFADDESLVDAPRMMTLARLIRGAGIRKRYYLYGRPDTIARNRELLASWRDIGLERVFVGFESFRDEDLARIEKRSSTADNAEAARILNDLGIGMHASFIVRPEFGKEEFEALRRYCRALDVPYAGFAVLTPLPGTDYYDEVKDALLTYNPAYFDFIHTVLPTKLPLEEFYRQYVRLVSKAVSPARIVSFLRKFPWRELPSALAKAYRLLGRVRAAHLDYATPPGPGARDRPRTARRRTTGLDRASFVAVKDVPASKGGAMRNAMPVDGVVEPNVKCRRAPALLALVVAAGTLLASWQAQVPRGLLVVGTLVPGLAAGLVWAVRGRQAAWSRRIVWVLFGASAITALTAVAWIFPLWFALVTLLLGASVVRLRRRPRRLAFFGALSLFMGGIALNVYALSPFVTHTPLSADPAAFRAVDLRVHGFLADVTLRDVWVIHLRGGGEGRSVLDAMRGPAGRQIPRERPSPALALLTTALGGLRLGLGWVLGLDREGDQDSSASYANRVTAADRTRCVVKCPGERLPPFGFRLLYHFDRELTYEVQNRTVHAFLSLALVPAADGYDLYYGVFVKRTSWMTPVYMATIDPFRRMVMYPSMLRTLERQWRTAWGQ